MPQFCAVLNCGSNSLRDKVSFYRFPSSSDSYKLNLLKRERREEWIRALRRTDLTETKLKNQRVCEKHFITGKPASLEERSHPDWVPSQNLGHAPHLSAPPTIPSPQLSAPPTITSPQLLAPPTITIPPAVGNELTSISAESSDITGTPFIFLEHNYCLLPPSLSSLSPSQTMGPNTAEGGVAREEEKAGLRSEEAGPSNVMAPPTLAPPTSLQLAPQAPPSPPLTPTGETDRAPPMDTEAKPTSAVVPKVEETEEIEEKAMETPRAEVVIEDSSTAERERGETEKAENSGEPKEVDVKAEVKDEEDEKAAPPQSQQEVDDSITRCICGFEHDDGFMICCDKCMVWQHVDCMEIERGDIPEEYLCELCSPRPVDKARAISLQRSKKKLFDEMLKTSAADTPPSSSDVSNSDGENSGRKAARRKRERRKEPAVKRKKQPPKPSPNLKKKKTPKREAKAVKMEEDEESMDEDSDRDLRSWIDEYEEAITNHYSPELRARVAALKASGVNTNPRLVGAHSARSKARPVSAPHGHKMLVGACNISSDQAIVELRGKYMVAKTRERGESGSPPRERGQQQFIFDYRIDAPGNLATDLQVDTTTYGNMARFVRSSCTPNAQLKHCIEKGTLHLYIVSSQVIEARKEITVPHRPGAVCSLGNACQLLNPGKRRNRKQVLTERAVSRESNSCSVGKKRMTSLSNAAGAGSTVKLRRS